MKIIVKIEESKPLICFPENLSGDNGILAFSQIDGHVTISRGYMRNLRDPETREELAHAWRALEIYAKR